MIMTKKLYKYKGYQFQLNGEGLDMIKPDHYEGCEIELGCEPTRGDMKTTIADYYDLPNRTVHLSKKEEAFIKKNFTSKEQQDILGMTVAQFKDELKNMLEEE